MAGLLKRLQGLILDPDRFRGHMWLGSSLFLLGCALVVVNSAGLFGSLPYSIAPPSSRSSLPTPAPLPKHPGIVNLSNTCYLNAIVQSLYAMKAFRQRLLQAELKKSTIGRELKALFQKMDKSAVSSSAAPIKPYGLVAVMDIDVDVQEDAEELLLRLLNGIEDSDENATDMKPTSLIKFKTLQRIHCVEHDHVNEKQLSNFDLSIDFRGCSHLEQALDKHFATELLSGENSYKCSAHGLVEAQKSLRMAEFPSTLVIHLKRFSFNPVSLQMQKVGDYLEVPTELDMAPYASSSELAEQQGGGRYSLQAVVVHEGNLQSGHYFATVREACTDEPSWVVLNDHQVYAAEQDSVLHVAAGIEASPSAAPLQRYKVCNQFKSSATGYLLFYTRQQ